jgi:hypothetical protein
VDQLAKYAAEIANRLALLPADKLRCDSRELDALQALALRLLDEISVARQNATRTVGETSGMWRVQPIPRR